MQLPWTNWTPVVGPETRELSNYISLLPQDWARIQDEAMAVVADCVPPTAEFGHETGLVIGYVQSGKTLSFTTVTALARDNNYRLIIVISGITRNLYEQTDERLQQDLRIRKREDRQWQTFSNPKPRPDIRQRIATALDWSQNLAGVNKQSVLITVMKNGGHLDELINLLKGIRLEGVPTLIIDDEADQASLNTLVKRGKESATYRRLLELRRILPHHTYLQYTATPQAPLLINITDILSPMFFELLTPGPAYTGGRTFFEGDFQLIRQIADNEVPTSDHPLFEPPNSLLDALRVFYLGVAVGLKDGGNGNRSMLVHPSKETMQHANYALMVRQVQKQWEILLASGKDSDREDRAELIDPFQQAYRDLDGTVSNLPAFEDLLPFLISALHIAVITEVNATRGKTPQPEWHSDYAHILIGGEVLNRGYTVKGLTVTYMPRGKGVGNADTIQQRARWFGYKADYLGFCRVYLTDNTTRIYRSLVRHEENVRAQLRDQHEKGGTLQEWRRALLSPDLRPTRNDVLTLGYIRDDYAAKWWSPDSPHESLQAVDENRGILAEFCAKYQFVQSPGDPRRRDSHKHLVARDVPARDVYKYLLTQIHVTNPGDVASLTGLLLQISNYLDSYPDAHSVIYQMRPNLQGNYRSVNSDNVILNLFQGAYPVDTREIYPGDRNIFNDHEMTLQLHRLDEIRREKEVIAVDVPIVAVRLPTSMSNPWIVQDIPDHK